MVLTKQIDEMLSKEMSRKDFIGAMALAVGSLFGLPALLGILNGSRFSGDNAPSDYGSRDYGP
jgi:hypothetical protein